MRIYKMQFNEFTKGIIQKVLQEKGRKNKE